MSTNETLASAVAPVVGEINATANVILDPSTWTTECAAQHFGLWLIEPDWFSRAVAAVKDGSYRPRAESPADAGRAGYVNQGGLAVIPIQGAIMKARSKFGGTSSVDTRVALRKAANDDSVQSILLHIDSPGGAVAGTFELAKDIANIDRNTKPVYAHIEDLGASGGYLLASQARRITADTTSYIGSIGVVTTLVDSTGQMAKEGIKVEVVSTGGMKGAGYDGRVTDDMRAEAQSLVDEIGKHFVSAVSAGRKMTEAKARTLADGRIHIADKAKELGLIDEVGSLDAVVRSIFQTIAAQGASIQSSLSAEAPAGASTDQQAPESSQRSDATPDVPKKEISPMAEIANAPAQTPAAPSPSTPQVNPVEREIAQLNTEAVTGYIREGYDKGVTDGNDQAIARFQKLMDAAPGNPAIAAKAFVSGQSPESVKMAFEAANEAVAAAQAKATEERLSLQKENARLHKVLGTGGHAGVSMAVAQSTNDPVRGMTPKAQAEWEWDNRPSVREGMKSKDIYVLAREAELSGSHRTFQREVAQAN